MQMIQVYHNFTLIKNNGKEYSAHKNLNYDDLWVICKYNHGFADEWLLEDGSWSKYTKTKAGLFTLDQIREIFSKDEENSNQAQEK